MIVKSQRKLAIVCILLTEPVGPPSWNFSLCPGIRSCWWAIRRTWIYCHSAYLALCSCRQYCFYHDKFRGQSLVNIDRTQGLVHFYYTDWMLFPELVQWFKMMHTVICITVWSVLICSVHISMVHIALDAIELSMHLTWVFSWNILWRVDSRQASVLQVDAAFDAEYDCVVCMTWMLGCYRPPQSKYCYCSTLRCK